MTMITPFLRQRFRSTDNLWLLLALLVAIVVVPTACLFWVLNQAVRNERLAVRHKLVEAYRAQITLVQEKLEGYWRQRAAELDQWADGASAPRLFATLVTGNHADSAICFDADGHIEYPTPATVTVHPTDDAAFAEAVRLEQGDSAKAADEFARVARESSDENTTARALQGQARCLAKIGRKDTAFNVLTETLGAERFARAQDAQGRLLVANADLMALELIESPADPRFQVVKDRLIKRVNDYAGAPIPAPQRRFLMRRLQQAAPAEASFPTMKAEEIAARWIEATPNPTRAPGLSATALTNICQFPSANGRVVVLSRCNDLLARIRGVTALDSLPKEMEIVPVPPGQDLPGDGLIVMAAGPSLPGWRLALKEPGLLDATTNARISTYFWTGFFAVVAMCVLAAIVLNLVRRQMALARLKNDLVANVTHELKTPLSSMRLLVDTLLNSEKLNEQTAREYLQLIAKENNRLSRLIDNFLTFSRMERNKHVFDFAEVSVARIVDGAVAAVRERFNAPSCVFDVTLDEDLPAVVADGDALVTALINLLDNAFKYSEDTKHIQLRARAERGTVCLDVQDNGIGLSPRETKKVFKRFYQVDQSLSRESGGCGLGLSIVHYIVAVHRGEVRVESEPGKGSTFTIVLPAAANNRAGPNSGDDRQSHRI
jgi:signal transduction histidine kinase